MAEPRIIYVTCADRAEAEQLARTAVEARLAACGNILAPMTSVYRWEGQIETAEEVVLVFKTTTTQVAALTEQIKAGHSYDLPCVLSLPIAEGEGNPDFLQWIGDETTP